ncbi:MAG: septum formation initiator family protein [Ferruginibacter sp.]
MKKNFNNTGSLKPLLRRFPARERTKFMGRLSWLKNKYLLTGAFFVIWMLFFDPKDLFSDFERRDKLNELQDSEQHLKQLITESHQELDLLKNDAQSIEKYAREKYLMKKDNEDLFIVDPVPDNK